MHGNKTIRFGNPNRRPTGLRLSVVAGAFALHTGAGWCMAQPRVAVIGSTAPSIPWCTLLAQNGYVCVIVSDAEPIQSLVGFDVQIDRSGLWADPDGLLTQHLNAGGGVITWGNAPAALGITSNATVQAWIGANDVASGSGIYVTTAADSILGDRLPGTRLETCNDFGCAAVGDTSRHPNARTLADFESFPDSIAILRNTWNSGQSVYLTFGLMPDFAPGGELILNAVSAVVKPAPIPAVSSGGIATLLLVLVFAGSVVLRRRSSGELSRRAMRSSRA